MDHVDYVYTKGMNESEVANRLGDRGHGVLALARGGEAYAIPLNFVMDDSRVLLRMSAEPNSTKIAFAETTDTATLVVYDVVDESTSWSVLIRGPIRPLPDDEQAEITDRMINEWFPPLRVFDEDIADVAIRIYELAPREVTGRRTVE